MFDVGDLVKVCKSLPSSWDGMIGEVTERDAYGFEVTFFNGDWHWFDSSELMEVR